MKLMNNIANHIFEKRLNFWFCLFNYNSNNKKKHLIPSNQKIIVKYFKL